MGWGVVYPLVVGMILVVVVVLVPIVDQPGQVFVAVPVGTSTIPSTIPIVDWFGQE